MASTTLRFGFYSAMIAFIACAGYCVVQLLQVINAVHFPLSDILIYGFSFCIAVPFMLSMLALHHVAPKEKKIWSHSALLLSILYAVYASFVYVVQLAVAIPQTIQGNTQSIQVITMSQHSFFWTLDALTYICLGIATFFASFVFGNAGSQKKLKWFLLGNAFMTPVIAVVYFYPHFSTGLLFLGSPWMITATGSMLLLALFFKKHRNGVPASAIANEESSLTIWETSMNIFA